MKCLICGKNIRSISQNHLTSEKHLKVLNNVWYERDLVLQKIEESDYIDMDLLNSFIELEDIYNAYNEYHLYNRLNK